MTSRQHDRDTSMRQRAEQYSGHCVLPRKFFFKISSLSSSNSPSRHKPLASKPPKNVLNLANHSMSRPITVPSTEDNTMSNQNEQPSMVGAHLNYVKGAAASALGYESGDQTKQQAVEEMREANKQGGTPTQSNILGNVESAAGSLTGCEGMQNEGESRKVHGGGESGGMTG